MDISDALILNEYAIERLAFFQEKLTLGPTVTKTQLTRINTTYALGERKLIVL